MAVEEFKASAQYYDWIGTTAADNADNEKFNEYFVQKGLINHDEFLVGIEFNSHVVPGEEGRSLFYINALLIKGKGADDFAEMVKQNKYVPIRKVDIEITVTEFFGLFKRFSIAISKHGLLESKEIQTND
ncbi:TPA: hypothetical protein PXJ37_001457 [Yersinia enterocolitica]|nr:hypothetical protein [Yersinia enterocolitica]ELI8443515.1 hypothetical protein [Yersinia enterocolitica]ELW8973966.1 hypothetical protein [Yersinia enterocolitica]HDL6611900.1 hypothetical protein [Yersinia enterocolitica]HDM8322125.1 hypothetical protein [Yersinia enterocolitica]